MSDALKHVAIIMDGNGRWALQRNQSRTVGHRHGALAVKKTVLSALSHRVPYLTLFAFSSENWRRPALEIKSLWRLFTHSLRQETHFLHEHQVAFRVLGDRKSWSEPLREAVEFLERGTSAYNNLHLQLAIDYGGRRDIAQAASRCAQLGDFREEVLASQLSTKDLPDPDLLIRTGGEQRLSNFLLFQMAYTELYFVEQYWPDFDEQAFADALEEYQKRQRRYGAVEHVAPAVTT